MLLLQVIFVTVASFCCSTNVWKGIIPLKTTKAEVEKTVGKPIGNPKPDYDIADYEYKDGIVTIVYSIGGCRGGEGDYDVPSGIVVRLSDRFKSPPPFSGFRLDHARFVEGGHPDGPGSPFFVDRLDGIAVWLAQDGQNVQLIDYFPAAKDDRLKCK